MGRFKEYYQNQINEGLFTGIATKMFIAGVSKRIFKGGVFKKLGLDPENLKVLTGGNYFKWNKTKQKSFLRDYAKYKNRFKIKGPVKSNNDLFNALKFFSKGGKIAAKNNPYYRVGMTITQFSKQLNKGGRKAFSSLKTGINKVVNMDRDTSSGIVSILKAIK